MNNKIINFVAFSLGAAAGAAVAWKVLKIRYEKQTREEIDSVIEYYKEKYSEKTTDVETRDEVEETSEDESEEDPIIEEKKANYREYLTTLREHNYTNYSDSTIEKKVEAKIAMDRPYVISPDEFGEMDGYETETLIFFSDRVLTDEMGNLVEDVNELINSDSLTRFGEYEEDAVHVRNDNMRTDYEILRDERRYRDVYRSKYGSEG